MSERCHRCDVDMPDDGEWFICPCCRSRTRGMARQQARFEQHMAELGMNEEEYDAYCRSFISTEPLPDDVLTAMAARMAREWKPACEHDTVNPFVAGSGEGTG